jgi:hypothetical protein
MGIFTKDSGILEKEMDMGNIIGQMEIHTRECLLMEHAMVRVRCMIIFLIIMADFLIVNFMVTVRELGKMVTFIRGHGFLERGVDMGK